MLEEEKQLKNGRSASKIQKCDHRTQDGGFSRLFLPKMAHGEFLASRHTQNRKAQRPLANAHQTTLSLAENGRVFTFVVPLR